MAARQAIAGNALDSGVSLHIALEGIGELGLELVGEVPDYRIAHCTIWDEGAKARSDGSAGGAPSLALTRADGLDACAGGHAGPILLVLGADEAVPGAGERTLARTTVARERAGARAGDAAVASRVEAAVLRCEAWDAVVSSLRPPSTLQDLVDFSAGEFDGCLLVGNAAGEARAWTRDGSPAAAGEGGWLAERSEDGLRALGALALDGDGSVGRDAGLRGIASAPMVARGDCLGWAVLATRDGTAPTRGAIDRLGMLARACALLVVRSGEAGSSLEERRARLFDRLLENGSLDLMELAREAQGLGFPPEGSYRLLLVDGPHKERAGARSAMVAGLRAAFPRCTPFVHAEETFLFVREDGRGMCLSRDMAERLDAFSRERDCICYSSDVVGTLGELWYAYGEVAACRMFRRSIAAARAPWRGTRWYSDRVYQFYESVLFFVSSKGVSLDFLNESYRMLPIQRVIDHDEANGTDDLVVLYCYLSLEQGVTATAERVHMHRNNVRYRIDAIRRRYGFDLDDPFVRSRLLNDYRFMVTQSPDFAERLVRRLG